MADSSEELQQRLERVLLGGRRKYTRLEVAEKAGVPDDRSRRLWRALGFATVRDDEVVFTDADVEAMRTADQLVQSGLIDPSIEVSVTRALGQHLSRLAEWQVDMLWELIREQPDLGRNERQVTRLVDRLLPELEQVQNFVWRRHLAAYAGRALAAPDEHLETRTEVVGFVDMVGYTRLTRQIDEEELSRVLDAFETLATEVIAEHHGRVVKMIGDEAMFVADSVTDAARIGLALAEAYADDDLLSDVRVALAVGPVLVQDGDYYGPVVNLASRVVDIAQPGSVLVSDDFHDALAHGAVRPDDVVPTHVAETAEAAEQAGPPEPPEPAEHIEPAKHTRPAEHTKPAGSTEPAKPRALAGSTGPAEPEFAFKAVRPRNVKGLGRVQLWVLYRAGGEAPTLERRLGRRWERLSEVLQDLDDLRERGERLITVTRTGIREPSGFGERLRSVARGAEGRDLEGTERE